MSARIVSAAGRRKRVLRLLLIVFAGLILFGKAWWTSTHRTDPWVLQSGSYVFARVNPDASLRLVLNKDSPDYLDVRWLATDITNTSQAIAWIESNLRSGDSVEVRLDRRRLDSGGRLNAYFFKGDLLLNAELIRQGYAAEATHPSDFAPIARELRRAEKTGV